MLTITDFSKSYNGTLVLSLHQLHLDKGIYWFKGENGSGKSTLFKSIAGIIPFGGEIAIQALNQKQNPLEYRRMVSYAEAEPVFPGFLTAKDLVRFFGRTRNAPTEQQNLYCTTFGVDTFFEKPCETFSSGMLKKLSLVLAFLGTPKLIILDEPLITLDQEARGVLNDCVEKAFQNGTSFLLSSHQDLADHSFPLTATFAIRNKTLSHD